MCRHWEEWKQFEKLGRGYCSAKHYLYTRNRRDAHSGYGHRGCRHKCDGNDRCWNGCYGNSSHRDCCCGHGCYQQWTNPNSEQCRCCECPGSLGDADWAGHVGGQYLTWLWRREGTRRVEK